MSKKHLYRSDDSPFSLSTAALPLGPIVQPQSGILLGLRSALCNLAFLIRVVAVSPFVAINIFHSTEQVFDSPLFVFFFCFLSFS